MTKIRLLIVILVLIALVGTSVAIFSGSPAKQPAPFSGQAKEY